MNMTPSEYEMITQLRERVTSSETKIDYIIENMDKLPPSPETMKRLDETIERIKSLETFKTRLAERVAWVSGAFAVVTTAAGYFIKEIIQYIHYIIWGN